MTFEDKEEEEEEAGEDHHGPSHHPPAPPDEVSINCSDFTRLFSFFVTVCELLYTITFFHFSVLRSMVLVCLLFYY